MFYVLCWRMTLTHCMKAWSHDNSYLNAHRLYSKQVCMKPGRNIDFLTSLASAQLIKILCIVIGWYYSLIISVSVCKDVSRHSKYLSVFLSLMCAYLLIYLFHLHCILTMY